MVKSLPSSASGRLGQWDELSYHTLCPPLEHFERRWRALPRDIKINVPTPSISARVIKISPALMRTVHPRLTLQARSVLEAVLLSEGSIGSARVVAERLGLRNRFQLARLLKRDGLPSLHRLAEWATVLSWVKTAEQTGASLCYMAFRSGRHPSACYRLVKEVTGLRWAQVRERGSPWVQRGFLREFASGARPSTCEAPLTLPSIR